ncbi:MAG: hypothetical protein EOO40_07500, partial [Deltaproteobacteria bacterium]
MAGFSYIMLVTSLLVGTGDMSVIDAPLVDKVCLCKRSLTPASTLTLQVNPNTGLLANGAATATVTLTWLTSQGFPLTGQPVSLSAS